MLIKEASEKWNISERRIRRLIQDGRIEGAEKIGTIWNIPDDATKPVDKRIKDEIEFKIDLPEDYFKEVDEKLAKLNSERPLSKEAVKTLQDAINLEWTYNSNGIEGNTLTLKETKVVLEGITIGGKSVKEHLEAVNHENAIEYLEELVKDQSEISEWNIKGLHQLILKGIDDDNAGKYRNHNVIISGAKHRPPEYIKVPELMEKLIINYEDWDGYHPIIRAALLHGELVKIHPFLDGNGRLCRLMMNMDLIKSGYVPVIIKKENRIKYYEALDKAHTTGDYTDFVKLITKAENEMLDRYLNII
ncbi:MAG: Fic family protein [Bacilli bacterium]|nr:Fic family protein [Bacilli bacterium]